MWLSRSTPNPRPAFVTCPPRRSGEKPRHWCGISLHNRLCHAFRALRSSLREPFQRRSFSLACCSPGCYIEALPEFIRASRSVRSLDLLHRHSDPFNTVTDELGASGGPHGCGLFPAKRLHGFYQRRRGGRASNRLRAPPAEERITRKRRRKSPSRRRRTGRFAWYGPQNMPSISLRPSPAHASRAPSRNTNASTRLREAPRTIRRAISCEGCATEKAMTP
jgi:hypothetical protein